MKFTERPQQGQKSEGPNLYVRIKDGEAINIIPRGEIYEFYSVFGKRGEAKESDPGARTRYKVNVIVNDGGTLKAKIIEFGTTVYDQLAEINKVCDVTKTKLRFSRKGSTKDDTVYMLIPVINEPLTPQLIATIEAIQLNVLGQSKPKDHNFPPPSFDSEMPDDNEHPEIPF